MINKNVKILGFALSFCTLLFAFCAPLVAAAHEVYVLDPSTVERAMEASFLNPFTAFFGNEHRFFFWGFLSFVVLSTILFASIFRLLEKRLDPVFFFLKRLAHPLVRLTVAASLISFGLYGALFGPELPLQRLFGGASELAQAALIALAAFILLGVFVRTAALLLLGLYAYAYIVFGWYVFTYTDHLGAYLLLLIFGSGRFALGRRFNMARAPQRIHSLFHRLSPYAFPLMRMLFGFGIMFASVYAKFFHSALAYQVVVEYNLTAYFPFDPLFVVLGALIIEFLAGVMMFVGVEIRWTGLFLIFWLTLSLLYFREAVWPHIVLFGLGLAIFFHGYDRYSLEGLFLKRHGREPVL